MRVAISNKGPRFEKFSSNGRNKRVNRFEVPFKFEFLSFLKKCAIFCKVHATPNLLNIFVSIYFIFVHAVR